MRKKYPGIINVVLAAIVVLSLLAVNVKVDSRPVEAGDQVWSQVTMPYDPTVAAMNIGSVRSMAVVSATTAFAATRNFVPLAVGGLTGSYIIRTTDGGKTWKAVGNFDNESGNAPAELRSLTVEANGPELQQAQVRMIVKASANFATDSTLIVALSEWNGVTSFNQVWRSKDGGDTFKIMGGENFAPVAQRIKALAVSPAYSADSDNTVVVGTIAPADRAVGGLYFWQGSGFETWTAATGAHDWYSLSFVGATGLIGIAASDGVATAGTIHAASGAPNFYSGVTNALIAVKAVAANVLDISANPITIVPADWIDTTTGAAPVNVPLTNVVITELGAAPPGNLDPLIAQDIVFSVPAAGAAGGLVANTATVLADRVYEYRMTVIAGGVVAIPAVAPQRVQLPALTTAVAANTAILGAIQNDAFPDDATFAMAFPSNWSAASASDRNLIAFSSGGAAPEGRIFRRGGAANYGLTLVGPPVKTSTTAGYASIDIQGTSSSGTIFVGGEPALGTPMVLTSSGDGGATWTDLSAGTRYGIDGTGVLSSPVQVAIGGSTVYVGTAGLRGGIFKGANLGASWTDTAAYTDNLNQLDRATVSTLTKIFAVMDRAADDGRTGLFMTEDGGSSWKRVARFGTIAGDVDTGPISQFTITGSTAYLAIGGVFVNQVRKSTDGGVTWAATASDPSDAASVVSSFATSGDKIWMVLSTNTIARSTDGGATWVTSTVSPPGALGSIVKSPELATDRTLIGMRTGASRQIFVSRDEGATWTEFGAALPSGVAGGTPVYSPDFSTDRIIYGVASGAGGGIWYMRDDGSVTNTSPWTQLTPMWTVDGGVVAGNPNGGVADVVVGATGQVQGTEATGLALVSVTGMGFSGKTAYIADGGVAAGTNPISTYDIKGNPVFWRHFSRPSPAPVTSFTLKTDGAGKVVLFGSAAATDQIFHFTDSAAAPALVAPANAADGVPEVTALTWNSVPNATLYEVAFGLTPALSGVTTFVTNETGIETARWYAGNKLIEASTYYWAVREKQPVQGPWSEIRSFRVGVVTIRPTSTPVAPSTPATVTASITTQLVVLWGFDAATQTWQVYDPAAPPVANTLPNLVEGSGYWLQVNAATTLSFGGKTRNLVKGWNLIGW